MNWQAIDVKRYLQNKEYIDTVILPLVPLSWESDMLAAVREGEFALAIASAAERELHGRVLLCPPFAYLKSEAMTDRMKRLKMWENECRAKGTKFVFFVTSDVDWKREEEECPGLIWFAPVPLEHLEARHQKDVIEENVEIVLKRIRTEWHS